MAVESFPAPRRPTGANLPGSVSERLGAGTGSTVHHSQAPRAGVSPGSDLSERPLARHEPVRTPVMSYAPKSRSGVLMSEKLLQVISNV